MFDKVPETSHYAIVIEERLEIEDSPPRSIIIYTPFTEREKWETHILQLTLDKIPFKAFYAEVPEIKPNLSVSVKLRADRSSNGGIV